MSHEDIYRDRTYLENNPTWHAEDSDWKVEKIIEVIQKNHLHPDSVCELGCGAGRILNKMSTSLPICSRFVGYEISPQAFELCNSYSSDERVEFVFGNMLEEDVFFDIVMAIDVIEHIEDYFNFLRLLKKKGEYKIFHIPLDLSVSSILRPSALIHVRKKVGHIHSFTKERALAILAEAGYEIIDHFYTYGSIDQPGRSIKRNLAKLPRKILFFLNNDIGVRILGGASLMVLAK